MQYPIGHWAFQWKMIFNPDLNRQAQELIFSRKLRNCFSQLLFNNIPLSNSLFQKHFGVLHYTNFLIPRQTLSQKIRNIVDRILSQSETQLTQTLLYGNQNYHSSIDRLIIISTIEYLILTKRFKCLLSE